MHLCLLSISAVLVLVSAAAPAWGAPKSEAAIVRDAQDKDLEWGPAPAFMPKGTELTVLHGDPSKMNADVLLRIPAKATMPSHWHTSAERMILISGELHVSYEGQDRVILKAGSYAYGPPKLRHDAVCVSDVPCVLFIAFESPVDAVPTAAAP